MKITKKLFWGALCLGSLTFTNCRNEDVYLAEDATVAKYNQAFKEVFGDFDPNTNWNMAIAHDLKVTTPTSGTISVYSDYDNQWHIVARYDVKPGTTTISFDLPAGVEKAHIIKESNDMLPQAYEVTFDSSHKASIDFGGYTPTRAFADESSERPEDDLNGRKTRNEITIAAGENLKPMMIIKEEFKNITDDKIPAHLHDELFSNASGTNALLPENDPDNYTTLNGLGAIKNIIVKTTGGPVYMTPFYRNTNSPASISYFYDKIENLPKTADELSTYMQAPTHKRYVLVGDTRKYLTNNTAGNEYTPEVDTDGNHIGKRLSFIYFDEEGKAYRNFPEGYGIVLLYTREYTFAIENDAVKCTANNGDVTSSVTADDLRNKTVASYGPYNDKKTFVTSACDNNWTCHFIYKGYPVMGFEDYLDCGSNSMKDFNDFDVTLGGYIKNDWPEDRTEAVASCFTIACEDMGSIGDFDFNDIVLNVRYISGVSRDKDGKDRPNGDFTEVSVSLCAAGGIYPIRVTYLPEMKYTKQGDYNNQDQFNVDNGAGYYLGAGYEYYSGFKGGSSSNDDGEIHQVAGLNPENGVYSFFNTEQSAAGYFPELTVKQAESSFYEEKNLLAEGNFTLGRNASSFKIHVNKGDGYKSDIIKMPGDYTADETKKDAPQVLIIKERWRWPLETVRIDKVYPDFKEWGQGYGTEWTQNINSTENGKTIVVDDYSASLPLDGAWIDGPQPTNL